MESRATCSAMTFLLTAALHLLLCCTLPPTASAAFSQPDSQIRQPRARRLQQDFGQELAAFLNKENAGPTIIPAQPGAVSPPLPPPAPSGVSLQPGQQAGLLLTGRFLRQPNGTLRFAWPGSSIQASFFGSEVALNLGNMDEPSQVTDSDYNPDNAAPTITTGPPNPSYYNIYLDGALYAVQAIASGDGTSFKIASNLTLGQHNITVLKRTEPAAGSGVFHGFDFGPGGYLLPPPSDVPTRRIEVIGDSISAGFGCLCNVAPGLVTDTPPMVQEYSSSTGAGPGSTNISFEDITDTYATLSAASVQAEVHTIAYSGKGVATNYFYSSPATMPQLYPLIIPSEPNTQWNFTSWVPQVVVINLGTNDFRNDTIPAQAPFIMAYTDLIKTIQANYGNSTAVICTQGPMLTGTALSTAVNWTQQVVSSLNDSAVTFLQFPEENNIPNGLGCNDHPNVLTHRVMAAALTPAIQQAAGW